MLDEIRSNGWVVGTMEYEIPDGYGTFTEGVVTFFEDGEDPIEERVILFQCDPLCETIHVASRPELEEFFRLWNEQSPDGTTYDIDQVIDRADVQALGVAASNGYLVSPADAEKVATARSMGVEPASYEQHLIIQKLAEVINDVGKELMGRSFHMAQLAKQVIELDPLYEGPSDEPQGSGLSEALLNLLLGGCEGVVMSAEDFLGAIDAAGEVPEE